MYREQVEDNRSIRFWIPTSYQQGGVQAKAPIGLPASLKPKRVMTHIDLLELRLPSLKPIISESLFWEEHPNNQKGSRLLVLSAKHPRDTLRLLEHRLRTMSIALLARLQRQECIVQVHLSFKD